MGIPDYVFFMAFGLGVLVPVWFVLLVEFVDS